jgi:hypothetical protein
MRVHSAAIRDMVERGDAATIVRIVTTLTARLRSRNATMMVQLRLIRDLQDSYIELREERDCLRAENERLRHAPGGDFAATEDSTEIEIPVPRENIVISLR